MLKNEYELFLPMSEGRSKILPRIDSSTGVCVEGVGN